LNFEIAKTFEFYRHIAMLAIAAYCNPEHFSLT
jgi:hypothetical protein